jgi:hypothetical protein
MFSTLWNTRSESGNLFFIVRYNKGQMTHHSETKCGAARALLQDITTHLLGPQRLAILSATGAHANQQVLQSMQTQIANVMIAPVRL